MKAEYNSKWKPKLKKNLDEVSVEKNNFNLKFLGFTDCEVVSNHE